MDGDGDVDNVSDADDEAEGPEDGNDGGVGDIIDDDDDHAAIDITITLMIIMPFIVGTLV